MHTHASRYWIDLMYMYIYDVFQSAKTKVWTTSVMDKNLLCNAASR